ncbi:MAG: hypothetical protein ABSC51_06260 [Gaiellaceae bacterium]|jgi:hypothetical protein
MRKLNRIHSTLELALDQVRGLARLSGRPAPTCDSNQRKFVGAALLSCAGLLALVFTMNVIVDPLALAGTGLVPSAVENDRAVKLCLIGQLKKAPEILILGSSRSRQAEPAFLQRLTGHNGFNAGVTGGSASDEYVFVRYTQDRFPLEGRRYIWFVDSGIATNGINPQMADVPQARKYLNGTGGFGLNDVETYLGVQATKASLRVLRKCVFSSCQSKIRYEADGSIAARTLKFLPEQSKNFQADTVRLIDRIRANPPSTKPPDPKRFVWFKRALAFMNAHGSRPVIVFNPIDPTVLAELRKYGNPEIKTSLAYLRKLSKQYHFVVVNCEDIRTWGGSAKDFTNPAHVNRRNMRRMLRYIVAHSDGALD